MTSLDAVKVLARQSKKGSLFKRYGETTMTYVDWHPVTVNKNSEIVSGDFPDEDGFVWVTLQEEETLPPFVDRLEYSDGWPMGTYIPHRFWGVDDGQIITAWAYCDEPKPYNPRIKNE